ncbi:MAG: glycosyltransferase [Pseudomonadota bacterium]
MSTPSDEMVVAAVAIGRNEGARLIACLESLAGRATPIVYVDSGSTDSSVEAAEVRGATVVTLDPAVPFTAARARNAGIAALGDNPGAYVQLIDGDCTLDPGWLIQAVAFLDANPGYAVVCGRRRERAPDASPWNRLADMEWNTPPGDAAACGGDALMRLKALAAVGGFREDLIAGEEPELCLRLEQAGWRIHRLDAAMTRHDAALTRFSQWWRRCRRAGWAAAEGYALQGRGPECYHCRTLRSLAVWVATPPSLVLLTAIFKGPTACALAVIVMLGLYALQAVRIARGRHLSRGDPWPHALLYGVFTMIGKFAEAGGALSYLARRLTGRSGRLIEYKGPS